MKRTWWIALMFLASCSGESGSPDAGAEYTVSALCEQLAGAQCDYESRCWEPWTVCRSVRSGTCESTAYGDAPVSGVTSTDVQRCYEDAQIAACSDAPRLDSCLSICESLQLAGASPDGALCELFPDRDGGAIFTPDAGR